MIRQFSNKQVMNHMKEIDEYIKNINKSQVLENIDSYDVNIKVEKNTDEYPLKKDFSKLIIHKKDQNKNTLYRDTQDNPCYIMYDDNYSSIEYDLENNIITCYGDNNKPCFIHSLNDNIQTWLEYDHNDNILYSHNSEGEAYLNFYTYYGKLLVKENFKTKLIKDVQINENCKIIKYIVDESERLKCHDGTILTLKYEDGELISYESDFCKWDKKHDIHKPEDPDDYSGKPCSYIETVEVKDFREIEDIEDKEYNYRHLTRYHSKPFFLKESNISCVKYVIEYYVYDDQGRKIMGTERFLDKNGKEHFKEVTFEYKTEHQETTIIKHDESNINNFSEYQYDSNGVLNSTFVHDYRGVKHYNKYGILVYDNTKGLMNCDTDGYLLLKIDDKYPNPHYDDAYVLQKEYVYNDNKIIIFKRIFDDKYNNTIERFKYNDNGKLIYYDREYILSKNKNKIHIYEYDEKDRLTHECLMDCG